MLEHEVQVRAGECRPHFSYHIVVLLEVSLSPGKVCQRLRGVEHVGMGPCASPAVPECHFGLDRVGPGAAMRIRGEFTEQFMGLQGVTIMQQAAACQ
jgi:hypothetical protein